MHLWLNDELKSIAPEDPRDAFEWVMQLSGETVRRIEKRHTFKIVLGEKEYFIKQHYAPMWKEALTDFLRFRHPILGAENEFRVSMAFLSLGVPTAEPVGVGVCGRIWQRRSFLITRALPNTWTINEVMRSWWKQPPSYAFKKSVIRVMAKMVRKMHMAGINHRDLYINHFRINRDAVNEEAEPTLYLMDLHRAHQQNNIPVRWLTKDLGSLLFSCLDKPLSITDVLYFIKHYQPEMRVQDTLEQDFNLWQCAYRRAKRERKQHLRKRGADPYIVAHAKGRSDLSIHLSRHVFR